MKRLLALALVLAAGCGGAARGGASTRGASVAEWARRELGRPYRSGGAEPSAGFDCSGLAWWAHKQAGLSIPRTSETQFAAGRPVERKALEPGDLVFFSTERRGPSHVGIFQSGGAFVHAPKTGRPVAKDSLQDDYWKKRYIGARRYW